MRLIKNTVQGIFTVAIAALLSTNAQAQDITTISEPGILEAINNPQFYDVAHIEVKEVEDTRPMPNSMSFLNNSSDCATRTTTTRTTTNRTSNSAGTNTTSSTSTSDSALGEISSELDVATVVLDKIINLGAKVWNVLLKSRPNVGTTTVSANALPSGVRCWYDLERWSPPRSNTYSVVYKNLWGFTVIKFDLRMMHSYGGRFQGKGRYLTNAAVDFANLSVAPGMFELNADVVVPEVTNVGTSADPVAAMVFKVNWTARGINHSQNTVNFVVYGDGRPTQIH